MGEVKSTAELEEHLEIVGRQWNQISQGVLTIRRICNVCWQNENQHQEAMGEGCQLRKLTPSMYFDELVRDIGELEKAAFVYEKGLVDREVVADMESHINQLVDDKQKMADEIRALQENVDYFNHQTCRRRRGADPSGWETGWDTSDNEVSGEESATGVPKTMMSAMGAPERGKDIMGHNTPMGSPLLCQVDNVARSRRPITGAEGIETLTAAATPQQPPSSTSTTTFIPDVGNTDPKGGINFSSK